MGMFSLDRDRYIQIQREGGERSPVYREPVLNWYPVLTGQY